MEINDEILEILEEYKIRREDGIPYLLSLYFGYNPTYIPNDIKLKVNLSKIVEVDGTSFKWNIPLFAGQEIAFEWVRTEYVALFKAVGKGTHHREATDRMKRLFAKHPDIRKEEVLGATELYLYNDKFPRLPHYFIEKGKGGERTQDILEWIDKYRDSQSLDSQKGLSSHNFNTLE